MEGGKVEEGKIGERGSMWREETVIWNYYCKRIFPGVLLDYLFNICNRHFQSNDKWKKSSQENITQSKLIGIYLTKGPKLSREHGIKT